MRDALAVVVDALVGALPRDCHDAELLADALWLAAASFDPAAGRDGTPPEPEGATADTAPRPPGEAPAQEERTPHTTADDPEDPDDALDPDAPQRHGPHGPYSLYENLPGQFDAPHDAPVTVAAGRALPQAVELGRSLRPFMRRFPHGRRVGLDLAATIDSYTRDGELLPVVGPLPEPWFDVLLIVDTHLSMEVWQGAVQEFAALLENSGAFRQVQRWHLSTEPYPDVTDALGRVVNSRSVAAPDGRRLVLVVSDCAAPAWYGRRVWQLLRALAGHCSLSIANPLPSRLWHRTALDLPAVRVRSRLPGTRNTALAVTVPPHLRFVLPEGTPYVAVPTLTLTAHSLNRWAQGLVRGSPEGYEAVLVTPFGAPPNPFGAPEGPFGDDGPDEPHTRADRPGPRRGGASPAEVFLRTASPAAVRLAGLCSAFRRLSLPLIQLIRQQVVPEATTSDVAELLMSNVLDISAAGGEPQVITFRDAARAPLARAAGRHDAWLLLDALSGYIAQRVRLPGQGLNAIAALDKDELPEALRPFAYASEELMAALRAGAPTDRPGSPSGQGGAGPRGPRPFLPDPRRAAALLIGTSAHDEPGEDDLAASELHELAALLTSPDGWNLPPDRCVRLFDADAEDVIRTARELAASVDEALLIWYVGHGPAWRPQTGAWVVGPGDEVVHPRQLLGVLPVDHLVVVEDCCLVSLGVRPTATDGPHGGVTWLTLGHSHGLDAGEVRPTRDVLRQIAEGVPAEPALLTADRLAEAAARTAPVPWSVRTVVRNHPDDTVPALARNRAAAPRPGRGAQDASVARTLARVRAELGLDEAGDEPAAVVEQVLDAFLRLLADRVRRPRRDRRPAEHATGGTFRAELTAFLKDSGVEAWTAPDSLLLCQAQAHGGAAVPVVVLNFGDASRWDRQHPVEKWVPPAWWTTCSLLVVLDRRWDAPRRTLAERVGVTRREGVGVVTLHFPGAPPIPAWPKPPGDALAEQVAGAVGAFCAPGAGRASRIYDELLSAVGSVPRGLSDPQLLSVEPDLGALRLSPHGDGSGTVDVAVTLEVAGLVPPRRLASLRAAVTILSGSEEDSYVFVAVLLPVVLRFGWHAPHQGEATVELQWVEVVGDAV
ncbi:SAV_2336 N-terminal domain-related protein [Streptomyces sp. G45]|uniref:SAV_2336 N-terminal domain-related protein n=1 Tax=Streptomyces sp. G45 TaxID=3406627 RepID=UPI003C26B822